MSTTMTDRIYPPGSIRSAYRNRLVNGDFRIDQRNAGASTSTADDVYCADRWYVLTQTGAVAVSQQTLQENGQPYNIRLTQSQASAQRMGIAQIVEASSSQQDRGERMALSFRVRCSAAVDIRCAILEWTGTADTVTSDVVADWTSGNYEAGGFFNSTTLTVLDTASVTVAANTWTTLPTSGEEVSDDLNNFIVMVWTEDTVAQNVTFDVGLAQLEPGICTPFEHRPYQVEQAMCRRFFYATDKLASRTFAVGANQSTTVARFCFALPVEMRIVPTLAMSNVGHFVVRHQASDADVTALTGSAPVCKQISDIQVEVAAGLTAGESALLRDDSNGLAQLTFSAEL